MVSKIRFGYKGIFYDAFDVTFKDENGNPITRRVVDKRLSDKLLDDGGDYANTAAQIVDEEIFYYLDDDEMNKSFEDIECIVFCVHHEFEYVGNCSYKDSDGNVCQYSPYQNIES